MQVNTQKQKRKLFDAGYVAQNQEVNDSVRATHALLTAFQFFGITVDKVTAKPQVVGPDDLDFAELEKYAHPDKPYAIAIDFHNVGGSSNLEGQYVGNIIASIRKELESGNDPFWAVQRITGWSPAQLLLAMYNAPGPNGEDNEVKKAVLKLVRESLLRVVEAEDVSASQGESSTPSADTYVPPANVFVPADTKPEPEPVLTDIVVPVKDEPKDGEHPANFSVADLKKAEGVVSGNKPKIK